MTSTCFVGSIKSLCKTQSICHHILAFSHSRRFVSVLTSVCLNSYCKSKKKSCVTVKFVHSYSKVEMGFRISDIFSMYLRHNDVNDYLDYLEQMYPNIVTVTTEGFSYEGRPLKTIRISYEDVTTTRKPSVVMVPTKKKRSSSSSTLMRTKKRTTVKKTSLELPPQKSVVLIDGGIHAREWISVATALYCIYELTEHLQRNKQLLRKLDFVIVPIVNVDGYEYTHTKVKFILEKVSWRFILILS